MFKKSLVVVFLLMAIASITMLVIAQDEEAEAPLFHDFETELVSISDEFNNNLGHVTWGDAAGNVELSIEEIEREGETTQALAINYDIGGWGGLTYAMTDGESWISQDWTAFSAFQFSLYGNNTGIEIQVEIFDNRNPDFNGDSAERYFYRIPDDYEGWQDFTIPFENFQRRSDFQPSGAPNDGFGLDAVSGYAFGMPAGMGAQTAYLDNVTIVKLDVQPLDVDTFEVEELFLAQDSVGNNIGYVPWGDTGGNVELNLIDAVRGSDDTRALAVNYDIGAWGGFSSIFNDGAEWVGQDWSNYNAISFWVLGSATDAEIQFEIFDNRNPDLDGDSAERWFYRFVDDSRGWTLHEIPFVDFQRRSDWQPDGALDDGFNLNDVSGYAFGMPAGVGSKVAVIDDMRLIVMGGVDMPEGVVVTVEESVVEEEVAPEAVVLEEVEPNADLLEPIPFAEPIVLVDFEDGVEIVDSGSVFVGFVPWGDTAGNALISNAIIPAFSEFALPEQEDFNRALKIDYNISSYGGFNQMFTDGESWLSQDWTNHNAFQFWLYGNNTGQAIQIELFDNLAPDSVADTAERYIYWMLDDYEGWREITIPFAFFQRRVDWQPGGAPDDGFGLNEIHGYAIGFPPGVGTQTAVFDNAQIIVIEDPSQVTIAGEPEEAITSVEIDESITWDSREWELLWADEFDADAGTGINTEFWTCEVGDQWFNNELQAYTDSTDNVAHDGSGNLVITATDDGEANYTSGRCITQSKMEFTYGRVEARLNLPSGQGIWPAFWMLGSNIGQVNWPASGEIDIMEFLGHETNTSHGTIHGPGYSGGSGIGTSYNSDTAFSDDFHVFAIDWDPHVIRWYVDGELFNIVSVNDLQGQRWVFDQDFFLLMNLAVGGDWPGNPDETTVFPQEMLVDYVRVYQLASE